MAHVTPRGLAGMTEQQLKQCLGSSLRLGDRIRLIVVARKILSSN